MKKLLGILLVMFLFTATADAQFYRNLHLSAGGGFDYYVGDLKENSLPHTKYMHLFWTVQLRYRINENWIIGAGYMKGKFSGADQWGKSNLLRDFAFESKLTDYTLFAKARLANWYDEFFITPHLIFGASYFRFNPMRDGIALATLGTEGQLLGGNYPAPYKLWSIAPKVGLEGTIPLLSWLDLDIYAIWATAFTDHIDDVGGYYPDYNELLEGPGGEAAVAYAFRYVNGYTNVAGQQRGNPNRRDGYIYFGANLTIWPWGKSLNNRYRMKCPDARDFENPMMNTGKSKKKKKKEQ